MPVAEKWVNPEVLRWARERLSLTTEQVVAESKNLAKRHFAPISEQELTAWESGRAEPELEYLETLAEIYACPVGFFFLDAPPDEQLPVSFRGLAKPPELLSSLSQRTLRRFIELAQWTVDTLRKTVQPWRVAIRPAQVSSRTANVEELAAEYRERFGWTIQERQRLAGKPREAFKWWRRAIESQGVFCFEMQLNPKETRGAALWLGGYPFILVNHQDVEAAAGRIFTLLHEFAHLISAADGVVCDFNETHYEHNPEPFANRFAAQILVTPAELRQRLQDLGQHEYRTEWPDSLIDKIRSPFFASRDVVTILLEELHFAPPGFYKLKREHWVKRNNWGRGGKRPPLNEQKLQEIGYSLATVLSQSAAEPTFSWIDAASVLGMKVEKAETFLKWAHKHAK